MRVTKEEFARLIHEEVSKSDINSLITSKLEQNLDSREFKKKVKEIAAEIVSNLFRTLWQQNSMWKRACQQ